MNIHPQLEALTEALLTDVQDAYEAGKLNECFNALQRLKVGAEAVALLADTFPQKPETKTK